MSTTPLFSITEWEQDQEQPHVTSNTAWRILEIMAQLVIRDRDLNSPPSDADDGDAYYVASPGSGDWDDQDDKLALLIGSDWHFITPRSGWRAWIEDEAGLFVYEAGSTPDWTAL